MAAWSLRRKLLLMISLILLVTQGILGLMVNQSLQATGEASSAAAAETMERQVVSTMRFATQGAAEEVAGYINRSFDIPKTVATVLSNTSSHAGGDPLARQQVKSLAEHVLSAHPEVSSIYAQFEPNGYDNRDFANVNQPSHSSRDGALEVYWYRDGTQLVYEAVDDPDEKYLSERDEFGIRESEWYLCSRDSLKPCLLEPYLYEISPGLEELMTSLSWPVNAGGSFRGLVGVDINLPVIQQQISQVASELMNGKGDMMLVSGLKLIAASSRYPEALGKPLAATDAGLAEALNSGGIGLIETDEFYITTAPIQVDSVNSQWLLVFRLAKDIALQESLVFQQDLTDAFNNTMWKMVIFTVISTVLAVALVAFIINSFIRPLSAMSRRFSYLSGAEGDLTLTLEIEQHKELIDMAAGFNAFTGKLRDMIVAMQSHAENLRQQSAELASSAKSSSTAAQQQFSDTETVAAAVHEMSTTAQEVSALAQSTSDESNSAGAVLEQTHSSFGQTVSEIKAVSDDMDEAGVRISQVAERSNEISGILDTIRGIAEQTNLLALNAAIEAARAGEQGRGFAVVADEVRNLAGRTQDSTEEINNLIQGLQQEVTKTVEQINRGKERVIVTVEETERSYQGMEQMTGMITGINDNAAQVATAAEQQSHVTEDINRNVSAIGDSGREIASMAGKVEDISHLMHDVVVELDAQLAKFKAK
ncbi:methyl-accepting chemotaxis protein [Neiella marina]|uniref:Methyl-accepting chemotaxis protein n=1 Tax=Neiella marina TaxID=508461 RepID=A0A8J2U8T2_9GAMM|nr:methyl-accepting chemotaxis protein [Neiella marina]GGA87399.1 methyl-accepting chemotaxis protein [Neiella marina]